MSDRALKKATELVKQFLNRMPGPERSAPDEHDIRMATEGMLRGEPWRAKETLQLAIKTTTRNFWKTPGGIFGEWMVGTGNHCTPFSTSTTVKHRMTDEEAEGIMKFLRLNAEAILFPIENEDVAVKRVRRVRRLPKEEECRVHVDEGMAVDEDGWPLTGDDHEPNEYGQQQRAAHDPYEPLHDEES